MRTTSFRGEIALITLLVFVIVALASPKSWPVNIVHLAAGAAWVVEKLVAYVFELITALFKLFR